MKYVAFGLLLVVGGCGSEKPATPTPEQSAQLNDAESMLNAAANEEGPADRSTGPSTSSN